MLTIGVDTHKTVHVAVAIDDQGREVANWRGPNTAVGWGEMLSWATAFDEHRRFGLEGAWGYGRGLAQYLVASGERVYEVNARWTAAGRRRARNQGKTDRLDAHAVAAFLHQEESALPAVTRDDVSSLLELLTVERDSAVAGATRLRNQLHMHLMQVDPEYRRYLPALRTAAALGKLKAFSVDDTDELKTERAATIRRLAARLELALSQADEVAARIRALAAARFKPLTRLCGVNLLTAGALAGMLGPGLRFATDAELAAYAGVSPLEASSAGKTRHRLNRTGNRRLNAVLYRIALTQAHHLPAARAYLDRRVAEGKTRREAHRALRRFVARAIFQLWRECFTSDP